MKKCRHHVADHKRLHSIYHGIKKRCYNKNSPRYKDYGGRGVVMCDEWADYKDGFDNFADWALSHGYTEEMTIERNDVDGNYCPENCSWITLSEQRNNQRGTIWVDYRGEHVQLAVLCKRLGLRYDTVNDRIIKRGWEIERAIETPSMMETSLSKKAKEHGLKPRLVRDRIVKLGWSEDRALNTPSVGLGANQLTYADS